MEVEHEFLKTVYIFEDLDEAELQQIGSIAQRRDYQAGEVICQEGTLGEEMYVIYQGCIDISKEVDSQAGISLIRLQPGEIFGELAYFDREPRSATACAFVPSVLLILRFKDLETLLRHDPVMASRMFEGIIRTLVRRLRQTDEGIRTLFQRMIYY